MFAVFPSQFNTPSISRSTPLRVNGDEPEIVSDAESGTEKSPRPVKVPPLKLLISGNVKKSFTSIVPLFNVSVSPGLTVTKESTVKIEVDCI